MLRLKKKFGIIYVKFYILVFTLALLSMLIYNLEIQVNNEYMGLVEINFFDFQNLLLFIIWIILVALLFPKSKLQPTNIFIGLHLLFVVIWGASLWNTSGKLDLLKALFLLFILVLPIFVVKIVKGIFLRKFLNLIRARYFKTSYLIEFLIIILLFISALVSYRIMSPGSFDFLNSYERRLSGREVFGENAIVAYLFEICSNGLTPLLAFLSVYRRRYFPLLISIGFSIYAFWIIGVKAPLGYVFLMGLLGWLMNSKNFNKLFLYLIIILLMIFSTSILEYIVFDYSWIAEVFIRRTVAVVTQVQGYYIDFILNSQNSLLYGMTGSAISAPFTIGEEYFNNPLINVNTNTFLYEIVQHGFIGYLICMIFVAFFFTFLDYFYYKYNLKEIVSIAFLYALLLTEQAYTTAFISSGVAVGFVLISSLRKRSP